jgi:hypothetical protein
MSARPGAPATPRASRPPASWRGTLRRMVGVPDEGPDWIARLFGLAVLIVAGVMIGMQYVAPDKRTLTVAVAFLLFGIAWRMDLISALGVLLIASPFPRITVFGSSNVVMVLAIAVIWLLRVTLRRSPPAHGSPVDLPLVCLLMAFVVSFYNIESVPVLWRALENFAGLLACVAMFYLILNMMKTPEDLHRLHLFQAGSIALVAFVCLYELLNPTGTLVPGWIEFHHAPRSQAINTHNLRIGGPFTDFELLSEYFAVSMMLLVLLLMRARAVMAKVLLTATLVLCWVLTFATVTRGGLLSFALGLLYLAWLMRRRLNIVRLGVIGAALVASFVIVNSAVSNFTLAGNMLARFLDPQTVQFQGYMPVSRASIWAQAFERMMRHPIIGHGPVYTLEKGLDFWYWPHNGYLYIGNLVGFAGLGIFLWLMARLWILSRPVARDLHDPNYARAFMVIGHVQLFVFLIDQVKIDFMRNSIYPYQIWFMFASIAAAYRLSRSPAAAPAPEPPARLRGSLPLPAPGGVPG